MLLQELFIDQRRQHPRARLLLKTLKQDRIGQRSVRLQGEGGVIHDADRFPNDIVKKPNDVFPILLLDLPALRQRLWKGPEKIGEIGDERL